MCILQSDKFHHESDNNVREREKMSIRVSRLATRAFQAIDLKKFLLNTQGSMISHISRGENGEKWRRNCALTCSRSETFRGQGCKPFG